MSNKDLNKFHHKPINLVFDVTDEKAIKDAFDNNLPIHQKIDVLINSSGTNIDKLFVQMTKIEFKQVLETNFNGTANVIDTILPYLKSGSMIINMASVIGLSGNIGQANYAASKDVLLVLTKYLAMQYASRGVLVNAVSPGMINTKMTDAMSEKMKKYAESIIPLKRFGKPNEVAELVEALSNMTYVTGQNFVVDGGLYMS
ncbi:SDR family oxidoreductase [Weissella paramesenteroides]|nr:SDR family oxidoreductase [Weissella paramesenteroides]KAA8438599.1 SDR family oxidoreductase [Weissella paramesenteroides]